MDENKDLENEETKDTEMTVATATVSDDEEEGGKYMLLDRLFKFIRTEDKSLNPVLSGYFFRLVNLLIMRK